MKLKPYQKILVGMVALFLVGVGVGVLYFKGYRDLSGYRCPEQKIIDCFPMIDPSEARYNYCVGEYHKWLENHCSYNGLVKLDNNFTERRGNGRMKIYDQTIKKLSAGGKGHGGFNRH